MTIILDATDMVLGRFATGVAKRLLAGESMVVVNAEKIVIVGDKQEIFKRYKDKYDRGHRYKGPFFPKMPHRIFKRTVRGMLPKDSRRGTAALKNLIVHVGTPDNLSEMKVEVWEQFRADVESKKFVSLGDVSGFLGWSPKF